MRFIALVSGGKDSIYSIIQALQQGHVLLGCLHMGEPTLGTGKKQEDAHFEEEEESYMYQTAGSSAVQTLVEDCLGVPLLLYPRTGKSIHTDLVYEEEAEDHGNHNNNSSSSHDEVEDLYQALKLAKEQYFTNLEAVCSGAILSNYQRLRIENVCSRLNLTSLAYLWRMAPQPTLLQQMLFQDKVIRAVLVKVACPPGLVPQNHLNKTLNELWDLGLLQRLQDKYRFQVCGEGGEYESLVLDSPLHQKKLILDKVEIVEPNQDGVGELRILQCHAANKDDKDDVHILPNLMDCIDVSSRQDDDGEILPYSSSTPLNGTNATLTAKDSHDNETTAWYPPPTTLIYAHAGTGGLIHFSEIMASTAATSPYSLSSSKPTTTEADLATKEALEVFSILQHSLRMHNATTRDVLFVHLYLSEISHFATINTHYQAVFGTFLPPSRSCVAVGNNMLPGSRRVLLDCMVQLGSGEYMRGSHAITEEGGSDSIRHTPNIYAVAAHATTSSKLRQVLHVQSISFWAPVCVGPYSQSNTLRSTLHFLAGQIGLIPATMTLHQTWEAQLEQCWKNVSAVLDALDGGSMKDNVFASLIYVSDKVYFSEQTHKVSKKHIELITTQAFKTNGSIVAGLIDSLTSPTELYGGYEDEGTWEEMTRQQEQRHNDDDMDAMTLNILCPTLIVVIPEMPKGALVEVEVIAATRDAAKSLKMKDYFYLSPKSIHDESIYQIPEEKTNNCIDWDTGHDFSLSKDPMPVDSNNVRVESSARVLGHKCAAIVMVLASQPSDNPKSCIQMDSLFRAMMHSLEQSLANSRSGLTKDDVLHIRLFYAATEAGDDGIVLRSAFRGAVCSEIGGNPPATSVVPVLAIDSIFATAAATAQALDVAVDDSSKRMVVKFALQALVMDPVHLETEVWIHKERH